MTRWLRSAWCCRWADVPSEALLQRIAARTEGYAGADLQALCTSAVMAATARAAPNLIDQLCNRQASAQQPQHSPKSHHHWNPAKQQGQGQEGQEQQGQGQQDQGQQDQRQQLSCDLLPQQQQQQNQDKHHDQPLLGMHQHEQSAQQQQRHTRQQQQGLQQDQQCQQQHHQQHQQQPDQRHHHQQQQQYDNDRLPVTALSGLRVRACDWKAALAAAPPACSARQGQSALSSGYAKALPSHLAPLLFTSLIQVMACNSICVHSARQGHRSSHPAMPSLSPSLTLVMLVQRPCRREPVCCVVASHGQFG